MCSPVPPVGTSKGKLHMAGSVSSCPGSTTLPIYTVPTWLCICLTVLLSASSNQELYYGHYRFCSFDDHTNPLRLILLLPRKEEAAVYKNSQTHTGDIGGKAGLWR